MRRMMASALGLSLGVWLSSTPAQEVQWRPAAPRPVASSLPPSSPPAASLGRPVALDAPREFAPPASVQDGQLQPASFRAATLSGPQPVVRAQSGEAKPLPPGTPPVEVAPPPSPVPGSRTGVTTFAPGTAIPATPEERYNHGVVTEPAPPPPPPPPGGPLLGGPVGDLGCCPPRAMFQSDHCFDMFASPITNPFLFEDPRALTEVRPIFIYQRRNNSLVGADIEWFGTQLRLAITDRWSFVMNKLGGIAIQPDRDDIFGWDDTSGFSEIWMGPKYTFLRNECTGTLGAVGLTFQIPSGPDQVGQGTGKLSLVPYVSFGQNFGRSQYGSFNFLGTTGYAFSVDQQRTDYYFLSVHLDYDVANLHKIYPMIELNWFAYTRSGQTPLPVEGRDLINFGSADVAGGHSLSIAAGVRYKFNEHIQAGIATEFPLVRKNDLLDFRLTVDLIFRY